MLNFVWKVKRSFRRVKEDMNKLKNNINDWIIFIDGKERKLEKDIERLEMRIERIEDVLFKIISLK